jgi:hypothetical protein
MNETYEVVALWADDSTTVEYSGKWWSEAFDAGSRARENGAVLVELDTLDRNGAIVGSTDVPHPAWS